MDFGEHVFKLKHNTSIAETCYKIKGRDSYRLASFGEHFPFRFERNNFLIKSFAEEAPLTGAGQLVASLWQPRHNFTVKSGSR